MSTDTPAPFKAMAPFAYAVASAPEGEAWAIIQHDVSQPPDLWVLADEGNIACGGPGGPIVMGDDPVFRRQVRAGRWKNRKTLEIKAVDREAAGNFTQWCNIDGTIRDQAMYQAYLGRLAGLAFDAPAVKDE